MNEAWRGLTLYSSRWVSPGKAPPLGHLSLYGDLEDVWDRQSSCCLCSPRIPSWFRHTCRHHRGKKKPTQNTTAPYTTLIGQMPVQSSLSVTAKSLSLTVNLLQLLSPIWHMLQTSEAECGRSEMSRTPRSCRWRSFLSVQGFFFCSLSLSPTRGAPMLFSTQGLQTRTLQAVLKWDTDTHTCRHAQAV